MFSCEYCFDLLIYRFCPFRNEALQHVTSFERENNFSEWIFDEFCDIFVRLFASSGTYLVLFDKLSNVFIGSNAKGSFIFTFLFKTLSLVDEIALT